MWFSPLKTFFEPITANRGKVRVREGSGGQVKVRKLSGEIQAFLYKVRQGLGEGQGKVQ